jgi:signal transduction histidine kinase
MQQAIRNLENINYQTQRMNRLIGEMVDLTRIRGEVLQLTIHENVDILACVRQIIEQQSAITGRPISLETDEQAIEGACDEDRLEQVLNNLINNAIKYSPSDKPVRVGVERRAENEVVIWVHDEGQGLSQEQQAHVFDEFYRISSEGTPRVEGLGLGLYIAKEIVTRMGGRMWLESTPGEGSTFYFSLPLAKKGE